MDSQPQYPQSITTCEICAHLPQKFSREVDAEYPHIIPPEAQVLRRLVEMNDDSTHRYCTSITLLLKCPACGTYYYHNHYDDEGEFFMDPASETITLLRYDAATAREFMQRIAADPAGALPNAMGRLVKAFWDGGGAPVSHITGAGLEDTQRIMLAELQELDARFDHWMAELAAAIQQDVSSWHIKQYLVVSLCNHFFSRHDWDTPSRLLLRHPDAEVRMLAAGLVLGIGAGDAPVMDMVHACRAARVFLQNELAKQPRLAELSAILLDLALTAAGDTLQYDPGCGMSRYVSRSIRSLARYYLAVAASHHADLLPAVPVLLGQIIAVVPRKPGETKVAAKNRLWVEKRVNDELCWILRTLAEEQERAPGIILDAFNRIEPALRAGLLQDKNVQDLIERCTKKSRKEESQ